MPARKEPWRHAIIDLMIVSDEVHITLDTSCCVPPLTPLTDDFRAQKERRFVNITVKRKDGIKSGISVPYEPGFLEPERFNQVMTDSIATLSEHCHIAMSMPGKRLCPSVNRSTAA